MRRVARGVVFAGSGSQLERGHKERVRGGRVAARPQHPAALERDAYVDDCAPGADPCRLIEQVAASVERAAQPLDPRQLRQHLRPTFVVDLTIELLSEPALAEVEITEVPQRPQPIHELDPRESSGSRTRSRGR